MHDTFYWGRFAVCVMNPWICVVIRMREHSSRVNTLRITVKTILIYEHHYELSSHSTNVVSIMSSVKFNNNKETPKNSIRSSSFNCVILCTELAINLPTLLMRVVYLNTSNNTPPHGRFCVWGPQTRIQYALCVLGLQRLQASTRHVQMLLESKKNLMKFQRARSRRYAHKPHPLPTQPHSIQHEATFAHFPLAKTCRMVQLCVYHALRDSSTMVMVERKRTNRIGPHNVHNAVEHEVEMVVVLINFLDIKL